MQIRNLPALKDLMGIDYLYEVYKLFLPLGTPPLLVHTHVSNTNLVSPRVNKN